MGVHGAIAIGAGHDGLTCACYLAKGGRSEPRACRSVGDEARGPARALPDRSRRDRCDPLPDLGDGGGAKRGLCGRSFERESAAGLRARILARTLREPVQEVSQGFDTVGGCTTHGATIPSESGASRPIPELGRYRTPVGNVYPCGSGTHPGGGVSMTSGRNAAREICADLGLDAGASPAAASA